MSRYPLVPVDPTIVIPQSNGRRVTKELLISQLQSFYKKYGTVPQARDTFLCSELSSQASYYGHLGESWDVVLQTAGLPTSSQQKEVKKKEYLDKLVEFKKEHGRAPKVAELGPENDMPSYVAYRTLFRASWGDILKKVDMQSYQTFSPAYSKAELRAKAADYYSLYGAAYDRKKALSLGLPNSRIVQDHLGKKWSELMKEFGHVEKLDNSQEKSLLIKELNQFFDKHRRPPGSKEFTRQFDMHSFGYYRRVFTGLTLK